MTTRDMHVTVKISSDVQLGERFTAHLPCGCAIVDLPAGTSLVLAEPSEQNDRISPQPPPTDTGSPAIWPLVIADVEKMFTQGDPGAPNKLVENMRARDEQGRAKYGVPLTADNGRDHLIDAYQELLDGAVYFRAEIERGDPTGVASLLYKQTLYSAAHLSAVLSIRDTKRAG